MPTITSEDSMAVLFVSLITRPMAIVFYEAFAKGVLFYTTLALGTKHTGRCFEKGPFGPSSFSIDSLSFRSESVFHTMSNCSLCISFTQFNFTTTRLYNNKYHQHIHTHRHTPMVFTPLSSSHLTHNS